MPKPETSARLGPSQGPPWEQTQAKDICGNRPESTTSPEQAWASDFNWSRPEVTIPHRSRPKAATTIAEGLRQRSLPKPAWASDFYWSRSKATTFTGAWPRQRPAPEAGAGTMEQQLREQAQARDICGTGCESWTSEGACLSQGHLWEQVLSQLHQLGTTWGRVLHRSSIEPVTYARASPRQLPPLEQREPQELWATPRNTEYPLGWLEPWSWLHHEEQPSEPWMH